MEKGIKDKKNESLTKKTYIGFFWTAGGKGLSAVAQIGVLAVLARLISIESFGIVQAALVVVGFAQIISDLGMGPALVQKEELTEKHIRVGFTFSMGLGLFLGSIVFLTSDYIAEFFKMEGLTSVLKVISLLFITRSFITVSSSLIQRSMKLRERALIEMGSYIFGYGLMGIIFGYLGFDYWALIIAIFAQELIKIIAYAFLQKHSMIPLWSKKEWNELIYFGGGFTIGKFFNYFASQGDNIITGRYLGAESLGIYSRAYAIMVQPISLIGSSIDKALFPAMAARQNHRGKLVEGFINGSKMMAFVCIFISIIIGFSSKEIVFVLLGEKWEQVILPLQILAAGIFFRMGYKMGDNLCRATGHVYKRAKRQFVYALAVVVTTYLGAKWGIVGVAYGTLISIFINYVLMIHLSLEILKISWSYFLKRILTESHIALIMSLIFVGILFIARMIFTSDILILMSSLGIFGLITMALFYNFSHKLSFIDKIPFQGILKKITKQP